MIVQIVGNRPSYIELLHGILKSGNSENFGNWITWIFSHLCESNRWLKFRLGIEKQKKWNTRINNNPSLYVYYFYLHAAISLTSIQKLYGFVYSCLELFSVGHGFLRNQYRSYRHVLLTEHFSTVFKRVFRWLQLLIGSGFYCRFEERLVQMLIMILTVF